MFNQYPYINENDLNLDYILKRVKSIEERLNKIKEEIEADVLAYVLEQLKPFEQKLNELATEVEDLSEEVSDTLVAYDQRISDMEDELTDFETHIESELQASIQAVNDLTDVKIAQNNNYIIAKVSEQVGDLITVLNPFTGTQYTIQDMVDYLAAFHIVDGIDYDTMNTRALTYNQWNALAMTYTQLVLHGNTDYN